MTIPGKSAGSGSISRLLPQFADRGRLNPTALRHLKDEQKSNREALRRVRAVNRLCDCKAPASARRNDDVSAVTQRKERTRTRSNREKEALFSSAKSLQITIRTDRGLPNSSDPCHQKGEQKSNREALRLETAVTQTKQTVHTSSNRENGALFSPSKFDRITRKRPRWDSRAGTPTSGVAGAASKRPYENEGKFQGRCGNTRLASDKIIETKQAEKRIKDPSIFVSVRKISAVCFLQLTRNLNDTMFRLERVAERTKFKGRAEFARGDANGGRRGRSERAPLRRQHQMQGRKVRFSCAC
jgi:hypothetical protein